MAAGYNELYLMGIAKLLETARCKTELAIQLLGDGSSIESVQEQLAAAAESIQHAELMIDEESARIEHLPIEEAARRERVVELHSEQLRSRKKQIEYLQKGIARL